MDEYTSARAALTLQALGIKDVRALVGGYQGWVAAGNTVAKGGRP